MLSSTATPRRIARRTIAASCALLICLPSLVVDLASAPSARAQVRPVYSRGAAGLGHLLQRLQTTASLMHTAAHPDDEDSALIARAARGDHARVTYLSLNRGEGGQNIIGTELFEPLGIIRTEELLQARRLDGGTQMFTRVFDYGFSKTRDEAARKWGERLTLGDMVRAIRAFRPLVITSRFSGTPADGHGQHQLAGYLTPLAFRAAADPREFPEQIKEGLLPWQVRKLYVGQGFRPQPGTEPTARVATGILDPLTGRTFFEIAAEGRSQHKSQEMGSIEPRGAQSSNLRLIESKGAVAPAAGSPETNIFAGLDTSITGIPKLVGYNNTSIDAELKAAQQSAAQALAGYDALAPQKIIRPLAEGLTAIRKAKDKLGLGDDDEFLPEKYQAGFLLIQKEEEFSEALRRAAGVEVDTLVDTETIVAGDSALVTTRVFVPEETPVRLGKTSLRLPRGWQARAIDAPPEQNQGFRFYRENAAQTTYFELRPPAAAPLTQPYWLDSPRDGDVFRWSADDPQNAPFAPPLVASDTTAEIGGVPVTLSADAQYRYADEIRGEIRRELNVVPRLSVRFDSDLLIAPVSTSPQTHRLAVRVVNHASRAANGRVSLRLPEGWTANAASPDFAFTKRNERATIFFDVQIPANTRGEDFRIGVEAASDGAIYARTMHTVAYPHIQTHRYYTDAAIPARVFDLKADALRVGYVMGSGDEVPSAIRRLGMNVTLLEEQDLATGDLARFDSIVVGIRASEVRPDFVANNRRLLAYVEQGGTLVVQYQRPDYLALNLAPYPAKMASRVTDETAAVKILEPAHPAFTFPNRIGAEDFRGWVQERNLYAFTEFDPRYTPLLETNDPGEPAQRGGQVYARIGRGHFVYTSYAWFRQLPAGVPGAYRQFANLLSLSKAPAAR